MSNKRPAAWSSVGKKFITGVTGFGLFGFVVVHLIGNLTLLAGSEPFNAYAHFLTTFGHGKAIYVAEVILFAIFAFHIVAGISVWLSKQSARPHGYVRYSDAGGNSQKTFSSKTMAYTGIILAVFTIIHVWQFRLGADYPVGGQEGVRDLYRLVVETFQNGAWVWFYVVAMLLLGFHLRHGFWSMFQSLGANNKRLLPLWKGLGIASAIILAVGFLLLPLYIHYAPALQAMRVGGAL